MIWLAASFAPTGLDQKTVKLPPISTRRHSIRAEAGDERILLSALNAERAKRGLGRLTPSKQLSRAARSQSSEMATESYFGHTSPSGLTCFKRMARFGVRIDGNHAGENLALDNDVAHAEAAMLASPGQRENMLDPRYKEVGIAVVQDQDGTRYYSEEFLGDVHSYVSAVRSTRPTFGYRGLVAATQITPTERSSHQARVILRLPLQTSTRN
jgi:uncharacterized protein YkwD